MVLFSLKDIIIVVTIGKKPTKQNQIDFFLRNFMVMDFHWTVEHHLFLYAEISIVVLMVFRLKPKD